ncbi:MAG TPA: hypothetical protein VFU58_01795 [Candidatus Nitrosotalea sp.]|nr:hypothetical protein [Candidatus Nitrosotalea sp.]
MSGNNSQMQRKENMLSRSDLARMITDESKIIADEIELLVSKRKEMEKNFEQLRKKLLRDKKTNVIDSSNWEDWKVLSIEYDEIKQLINEIDEKCSLLKQIQTSQKKKHKIID